MKIKSILILIVILTIPRILPAWSSIYGFGPNTLGTYQYPYSTAALGRGGFAMATIDSLNLNLTNFSTWSRLTLTTFTLNMEYQGLNIKSARGNELNLTDASFKGGYIAWPLIQRKLAMGIGLSPLVTSDLGIKISNVGIGAPATQSVESQGTISVVKLVFAYRISDHFSIGLVPNFHFGIITDQIKIRYSDIAYGRLDLENKYQVYGVGAELSGYYETWQLASSGCTIQIADANDSLFHSKITIC